MKCDLHVHTLHSGMCTVPVMDRICRESYNDPDEVYRILKGRGMNLVTVTDHDSIEASRMLFPRTWAFGRLRLWRIDYVLLSPGLTALMQQSIPAPVPCFRPC